MNTAKFYDEWSTTYDSDTNRTRDLDERVMRETFADSRFRTILELGCGTGKNTSFLARIGKDVEAFDFSPNMIEKAKAKVQGQNIRFNHVDITSTWPVENSSVDLIVCNLVLEHIEELSKVFAEAQRTLIGSGTFFISELHPFRQYQGVKANFKRTNDAIEEAIPQTEANSVESSQSIESEAFVHHISEFLQLADSHQFILKQLKEWWHEEDTGAPPRLVTFEFEKRND